MAFCCIHHRCGIMPLLLGVAAILGAMAPIHCAAAESLRVEAETYSESRVNADVLKNGGFTTPTGMRRDNWGGVSAVTDWQMATELDWKLESAPETMQSIDQVTLRYACGAKKSLRVAILIDDHYAATTELKPTGGWDTYSTATVDIVAAYRRNSVVTIVNLGWETLVLDWFELRPAQEVTESLKVPAFSRTGVLGQVGRRLDYAGVPALTDWQEGVEVSWRLDRLPKQMQVRKITLRYISADAYKPFAPVLVGLVSGQVVAEINLPRTANWNAYREQTVTVATPFTIDPGDEFTMELRAGGAIVLDYFTFHP